MQRVLTATAAALFVLATASASAQTPVQTDPQIAAAMDFVQASNAKQNVLTLIDAMQPLVIARLRRERPDASDAAISAFQKAFRAEMLASVDGYLIVAARVYATHFSVSELNAMSVFWRSDVGQKYLAAVPDITKEVMPVAQAWGAAAAAKAVKTATERVKQRGLTL